MSQGAPDHTADAAAVAALEAWAAARVDPATFPYDHVLTCFHRVGKHFVPDHLLDALEKARSALVESSVDTDRLAAFLDVTLDKRDGRYDYLSYLALGLLPLPVPSDFGPGGARWRHDRLVAHLVADIAAFELAAQERSTDLLPVRRPGPSVVTKRLRHAQSITAPARQRLGLASTGPVAQPRVAAGRMVARVAADQTAAERTALRLSILPVDTEHDEYLFIRVLQAFEATFALLVVLLRCAVDDVTAEGGRLAAAAVARAERALRECAPLFSLLATMQVESFRTFRSYTEGASAIQSRNYKLVESLCRRPDPERVDSAAYTSVPDVRHHVLAGQPTLEDAVAAARLGERARDELTAAMRSFATTLGRWRQTHYRLAVRMLGGRGGTGYTLGTPYLDEVRTIPIFRST